ncbi:DUF2569 domain-containing protein [Martelella alba]|uniref:DUF2569 domain-containing protein n=2 Tax=Martelella alba TaxID=2590451 RepID=A0ABY2SJQ7_9HYPH|nr:DUF2569 domain-containing protein [Martelella alba]
MALLSASLMIGIHLLTLIQHWQAFRQALQLPMFGVQWFSSLATALAMWLFSFWVLRLLVTHSRRFPKMFILWLLAGVLLGLKTFAFSPVTDALALRTLMWPLLAAALGVPYIKRSLRVRQTFTRP